MFLITNRKLCDKNKYESIIYDACKAGVEYIIIREKDLDSESLEKLFMKVCVKLSEEKTIRERTKIIINSNTDIYRKKECDGIHLPFSLFKSLINENFYFDKNKLLGISLHSIEDIDEMEKIKRESNIKVDYITLSHIFETDCKKNFKPKGLKLLEEGKKHTDVKIIALGGINSDNVSEVMKYADDYAVMSEIMKSDNVYKTVENLKIYK